MLPSLKIALAHNAEQIQNARELVHECIADARRAKALGYRPLGYLSAVQRANSARRDVAKLARVRRALYAQGYRK